MMNMEEGEAGARGVLDGTGTAVDPGSEEAVSGLMDGRRGKKRTESSGEERSRARGRGTVSSHREECVKPDDERLFLERR